MKGFIEFMGQFLTTIALVALSGLAGWLVWLSWDSQSLYQLIAAVALVGIVGLLLMLITTTSIIQRMWKIERAMSGRPARPQTQPKIASPALSKATQTPIVKPVVVASTSPIPNLQEEIDRLNKKRAEDDAAKAATDTLKEAAKEIEKAVAEKTTEKPTEKPVTPSVGLPVGRKPKEQPASIRATTAEVVDVSLERIKTETTTKAIKSNGNGTHNENLADELFKVCPKCGVKGRMMKFGLRDGRQKWHCKSCGKVTVEPQKKIGVAT